MMLLKEALEVFACFDSVTRIVLWVIIEVMLVIYVKKIFIRNILRNIHPAAMKLSFDIRSFSTFSLTKFVKHWLQFSRRPSRINKVKSIDFSLLAQKKRSSDDSRSAQFLICLLISLFCHVPTMTSNVHFGRFSADHNF